MKGSQEQGGGGRGDSGGGVPFENKLWRIEGISRTESAACFSSSLTHIVILLHSLTFIAGSFFTETQVRIFPCGFPPSHAHSGRLWCEQTEATPVLGPRLATDNDALCGKQPLDIPAAHLGFLCPVAARVFCRASAASVSG